MDNALIARFIAIVGEKHALTTDEDKAPHLREWRQRWTGQTPVVLKPSSTEQVSQILSLAQDTGTAIVPQGGNTGLVGGQIPDDSGQQIVVSLSRLNAIRALDPVSNVVTAEAGCILHDVQAAADAADRLFPLSLASQGSCQIGGNLSTNAGGTGAITYGVARDLCLGLEMVLPSGDIVDDLSVLKKDNTGYALRHLFIGAEGTLGIITAATLRLFPKPAGQATALVAVGDAKQALALLHLAQARFAASVTTFELMADKAVDFTVRHMDGVRAPFAGQAPPWTLLVEVSSPQSDEAARSGLEALLAEALAQALVTDAVIAKNEGERKQFWHLREGMSEAQTYEGVSIKHDISVPVGKIPAFVALAQEAVLAIEPGARPCVFGHLGDGNLHYNVSQPAGQNGDAFVAKAEAVTDAVHAIVGAMGGSISAEHGIGQMKKDMLADTKPPAAMAAMRAIKKAMDPKGIMNPGKVLDA